LCSKHFEHLPDRLKKVQKGGNKKMNTQIDTMKKQLKSGCLNDAETCYLYRQIREGVQFTNVHLAAVVGSVWERVEIKLFRTRAKLIEFIEAKHRIINKTRPVSQRDWRPLEPIKRIEYTLGVWLGDKWIAK